VRFWRDSELGRFDTVKVCGDCLGGLFGFDVAITLLSNDWRGGYGRSIENEIERCSGSRQMYIIVDSNLDGDADADAEVVVNASSSFVAGRSAVGC